jgi:predicted transcriptional regulator
MEALYRLGEGTAAQILEQIADPPSYTAIRTLLTILEKKGHIRHRTDGPRYVYQPAVARAQMGRRAIENLLTTFFDNSMEKMVVALLDREKVPPEELDRLSALIAQAKAEAAKKKAAL